MPKPITKEELIERLRAIKARGWIENARPGNDGGVGNTLEDLLGIEENNLPIPNASEWELKCQRLGTSSLTTLFHLEPSPRALKLVPSMLLPKYGWPHPKAGRRYPPDEMSFRQTIRATARTDRGFGIVVDRAQRKIVVSFDARSVDPRHRDWLESVRERAGLGELDPQPYWGFDDLFHKAGTKLHNCFYVGARVKRERGKEFYHYCKILMLERLSLDRFIGAIAEGLILVDFDARTRHNHGTKFRFRKDKLPMLYERVTEIT
ncbi:MAG: MvaI/BcnI restriction endonuclease family protein [Zetaproteobacteria bacterium]|nr:MAG: MvaI/BcnI restriction endonuclease family protein [Zetaproteobacteria bacterium]